MILQVHRAAKEADYPFIPEWLAIYLRLSQKCQLDGCSVHYQACFFSLPLPPPPTPPNQPADVGDSSLDREGRMEPCACSGHYRGFYVSTTNPLTLNPVLQVACGADLDESQPKLKAFLRQCQGHPNGAVVFATMDR